MEPIKLEFNVDTEKINQALRNTSDRLSAVCNSPEFQLHIERLNRELFVSCDRIQNAVNTGYLYRSIGLGNLNCINNAHSVHLRCAINPTGECSECSFYES